MTAVAAQASHRRNYVTIGESFSGRQNSLNFVRLLLAFTVVFSHAVTLGGFGSEAVFNTTFGSVAVDGFFAISGFLIASSAMRNPFGRYLWQRFLRIFPAYWLCLAVTGFLFGSLAWSYLGQAHPPQCTISCYLSSHTGPWQYFYRNASLRVNQAQIAGTPHSVPLPFNWNVSLWTLEFEFACYLLVGALALIGLLRLRQSVVVLALASWTLAAYVTFTQESVATAELARLIGFIPLFLAGSLLYLYRDKIPDSGYVALASVAIFVGSLWLPFGNAYTLLFPQLNSATFFSPFLVYPVIWLGIHLPFQKIGSRNDYSYGVYLYASPFQQLLAMWNVQRWGEAAYMLIGAAGTFLLAVASWWAIEKHALKLKHVAWSRILRLNPQNAVLE